MTRRILLGLSGLFVVAAAAPAARAADRSEESFAIVVATNRSVDPDVRPLEYADDDAARFYEWASTFSRHVVLLTALDDETQKLYPGLVRVARPATRAALRDAMQEIRQAMRRARARGARTSFYFYYAGHGDVGASREGTVSLADGRFSRSDLFREVIGRSTADVNHVIIDACNSYFLVNRRGPRRASSQEAIRLFLERESLERYPNTGVVLSTATVADSHEWSRYRSGIFSHQLLSALWGTADVDGDRRVDYAELSAYIAAANRNVRDNRARLQIHARPPRADRKAALVDLDRMQRVGDADARPALGRIAGVLTLPAAFAGHYWLEDDRGVRQVDFHKSAEQPLRVVLLDRGHYTLRTGDREATIDLDSPGDRDGAALEFGEVALASRGAVERSFQRDLYAFPFGQSFAAGHATAEEAEAQRGLALEVAPPAPDAGPWYGRLATWKWATAGTAAAALGGGIAMQLVSRRTFEDLEQGQGRITQAEAVALQERGNRQRTAASIGFGIAGTAALTSVILFALDADRGERDQSERERSRVQVGAGVEPEGGSVTVSGTF